jgi:hypothetical protein
MSEQVVIYEVTLSKEDAAKLANKADEAEVFNDLEYLETKIKEWLNK